MRLDVLKAINAARRERRAGGAGHPPLRRRRALCRGGRLRRRSARRSARSGVARRARSGPLNHEGDDYFLTVQAPSPRLVMIGAVHISQALAPMARIAGFDVLIIDPRTAFATPGAFSRYDRRRQWPDEALAGTPLDRYTAIGLLTHDPKIDDPALEIALRAQCFYIGALGSRKTHAKRLERMRAKGFDEAALARIHAPIGLDIGAVSPAEIAVSIIGEIVARCARSRCAREQRRRARREIRPDPARRGGRRHSRPCACGSNPLRPQEGPRRHAAIASSARGGGRRERHRRAPRARRRRRERSGAPARRASAGEHLSAEPPFTGRVNLFARKAGLVLVDARRSTRQRRRRGDHGRDAGAFRGGRGGRHGRDRQDHSLRRAGRRRSRRRAKPARDGAVRVAPFRPLQGSASSRPCCPGLKPASSPRRCACSRRASRRRARRSSGR